MCLFGLYGVVFHIIIGIFLIPLYASQNSILSYQIFNVIFIINSIYMICASVTGFLSGISLTNKSIRTKFNIAHIFCTMIAFAVFLFSAIGVSASLINMAVTKFGTLMICLYLILGSLTFLFFIANSLVQIYLLKRSVQN